MFPVARVDSLQRLSSSTRSICYETITKKGTVERSRLCQECMHICMHLCVRFLFSYSKAQKFCRFFSSLVSSIKGRIPSKGNFVETLSTPLVETTSVDKFWTRSIGLDWPPTQHNSNSSQNSSNFFGKKSTNKQTKRREKEKYQSDETTQMVRTVL